MNTLVDFQVPSEDDIYSRVASRVNITAQEARTALAEHSIRLATPLPARRSMCVHRLYCEGVKHDTDDNDGPFEIDIRFGAGPWALASRRNSAGKSNLLWALSWTLRGEGFDEYQRGDTVDWFRYIRADAEIAGVPLSVRVAFDLPHRVHAELLTSDSLGHLLALPGRERQGDQVRHVAAADGVTAVKELIGRFMSDRLGLRSLTVQSAEPGAPAEADGSRDSTEQVHGWASFFHAIALNAGHDRVLLGPTQFGALPARLMQIFLDVPYVTDLSEVTAALKHRQQLHRHGQRRQSEDRKAREQRLGPVRAELDLARQRLAALSENTPDARLLLKSVQESMLRVRRAAADGDELAGFLQAARRARRSDERALKWAQESAAARTLLGALDPEICPRCEADIDDGRRTAENAAHLCAVCTSPLQIGTENSQSNDELLAGLRDKLDKSREAESKARTAWQNADAELKAARSAQAEAESAFDQSQSSSWFAEQQEAAAAVHRLEGVIALLEQELASSPDVTDDTTQGTRILEATEQELRTIVTVRSRELFQDVSTELVRLARRLGVTNLTSVDLKLNGTINARKSGTSTPYRNFSPGERLRMRIAAVVAMITVGQRHGIASHPGLLLIDAPTAEEVVPGDAREVLAALHDLAATVDGMQLIITTMNDAIWEVFPEERIIRSSAGPGERYMF